MRVSVNLWHDGKMKTWVEYRLLKTNGQKGTDIADPEIANRQENVEIK